MLTACGGAFGSMAFGAGPFGSGTGLGIASAYAERLNAIVVSFDGIPRMENPGDVHDALNPGVWSIEPVDPPDATDRIVQFVERIDASTARVWLDGALTNGALYSLSISTEVVGAGGGSIDPLCTSVDVRALYAPRIDPLSPIARSQDGADLANPQTVANGELLGTLQITEQGDYALERGRPYLRKRVIRRATTATGAFFHLPTYGFLPSLKGLLRADTLATLKARVEEQIRREPGVKQASVAVEEIQREGVTFVLLSIRIVDTNGVADTMEVPVELPGG